MITVVGRLTRLSGHSESRIGGLLRGYDAGFAAVEVNEAINNNKTDTRAPTLVLGMYGYTA